MMFYSVLCAALAVRISSGFVTVENGSFNHAFLQTTTGFRPGGRRRYEVSCRRPSDDYRRRRFHLSSSSSENTRKGSIVSSARPERVQHRDVVVVGCGLAGLSAALYLTQMDPSRHVTVLDRLDATSVTSSSATGSFAAAGMLAPQSERLPKGHLLDLCLASRRMYPDYCELVEGLARESGSEGEKYYKKRDSGKKGDNDGKGDPWSVGYMATGGFLAPAFAGDTVATWAPPDDSGSAIWMDATQVRELEPNLHPDVGKSVFPRHTSIMAEEDTLTVDAEHLSLSLTHTRTHAFSRWLVVPRGCQRRRPPPHVVPPVGLCPGWRPDFVGGRLRDHLPRFA